MLTSLLSFFGGSIFRMLWGEIAAWISAEQQHKLEMARMALQADLEDRRSDRMNAALKLQNDLGMQMIEAKSEATLNELDAQTFLEGVKGTMLMTGVRWVDAWNQTIRPMVATWAIVMLTLEAFGWLVALGGGKDLPPGTREVVYAALGLYLADRTLAKRGK